MQEGDLVLYIDGYPIPQQLQSLIITFYALAYFILFEVNGKYEVREMTLKLLVLDWLKKKFA
jgi:hypothetical protein